VSVPWKVVPLAGEHRKECFNCGEPELDAYLKELAGQHAKRNISRTYVAVANEEPCSILGFYTLSMAQVAYAELPPEIRRKLPKHYPIPAARLARLAVERGAQGMGVGAGLLMNALVRCVSISQEVGAAGIIVDAKHEKAQAFYLKYGFIPLANNPLTLFMPMQVVLESIPAD
jgi:GNAT superfamily N-acetyltransferase